MQKTEAFQILKCLLLKELLVIKNTFFRTRTQITGFVVLLAIGSLILFGMTRLISGWLLQAVEILPGDITGELFGSSIMFLYVYITFLVLFNTMQECREKLLVSPELQMLLSVPTGVTKLIISRFLISVVFNRTTLIQMFIFFLPPLIAFGVVAGAPFYYYVLLAPVTYLFLVIPASLGVIVVLLLVRLFSPKKLFRATSLFSFLLTVGMFGYVSSQKADVFVAVRSLSGLFIPFRIIGDIWTSILGLGGNWGLALILLTGATILSVAGAALTVSKTFFSNAERLQTTTDEKPGRNNSSTLPGYFRYSNLGFLTFSHWRMAFRNKEMAQGTLALLAVLAAYVIIIGIFISDGPAFIMLISIMVVAGLVNMAIQILFLPFTIAENRSVLQQQYWIVKSSPLKPTTAVLSLIFANVIPALILGLPLLLLVNFMVELTAIRSLLSLGILAVVMISSMTIDQWSILKGADSMGNRVPLFTKIIREAGTWLYLVLIMLPLTFGYYYRYIPFLTFLHTASEELVVTIAVIITVLLAMAVLIIFYRRMVITWENMEIG